MNKYIPIILSATIFLIFGYYVFSFPLNTPSFDDYDATLTFIRNFFFEKQPAAEKWKTLFLSHNEHRIFVSRLVASIYFTVFHQLNFTHLVIIQNVFLLGCIFLMFGVMLRSKFPLELAALVLAVFLMNFSFWQVTFYYWGGVQYYTVIFFSILTLLMLTRSHTLSSGSFFLSVTFALLAVFSFGNGILAMLLGAGLLWAQRKYKLLVFWAFLLLATGFLFLTSKNVTDGHLAAINVDWMARLFFTFLGSFLFVNPQSALLRNANIIICALSGLAVFVFWVRLFITGYWRSRSLFFALFSLPVLTGLIISVSRFTTKAAGGIAPRYMFFSGFIPVIIILILWDKGVIRRLSLSVTAFAGVLLWGLSFYNNRLAFISYNREIATSVKAWEKDRTVKLFYFADVEWYSQTREWALKNRVIADHDPDLEAVAKGEN